MCKLMSAEYGGMNKFENEKFKPNGEYTNKVFARLQGAQDPKAAARKLVDTLAWHANVEIDEFCADFVNDARTALAKLESDLLVAGDDPALKATAFRAFAEAFAAQEANTLNYMFNSYQRGENAQAEEPTSFARAITDVLFDDFNALRATLGEKESALIYGDAYRIVNNELKVFALLPGTVADAIRDDARRNIGGDNSYKIDIGV